MYTQKCATFYGCYCCWRSRKRIAISFVCSFTHANKNWNWMCRFDKRIKGIESAFESTYATLYVMAVPFQVSNESLANASQMKATITGRTSSLIQMDYSDVSHRTNGHPPIKWLLSVCNVDFDARLSLSLFQLSVFVFRLFGHFFQWSDNKLKITCSLRVKSFLSHKSHTHVTVPFVFGWCLSCAIHRFTFYFRGSCVRLFSSLFSFPFLAELMCVP